MSDEKGTVKNAQDVDNEEVTAPTDEAEEERALRPSNSDNLFMH